MMAPQEGAVEASRLPETYAVSELYMVLRACERFGIDPFNRWHQLTPGEQAVLMGYNSFRLRESR